MNFFKEKKIFSYDEMQEQQESLIEIIENLKNISSLTSTYPLIADEKDDEVIKHLIHMHLHLENVKHNLDEIHQNVKKVITNYREKRSV